MAEDRIGGLTCKPPISKGELGGRFLSIIGEMGTKNLSIH
jgi:hypothetical protein